MLSHDIEGAAGVQKVKPLANSKCTTASAPARISPLKVTTLYLRSFGIGSVGHGFEVGVHDLKHDGKLFRSHAEFQNHAVRINRYLNDWGAGWFARDSCCAIWSVYELNVQYDASTFDTDPFEPQPDGASTIFPFWIANPKAGSNHNHNHDVTSIPTGPVSMVHPPLPSNT